ncbi:hypothetical protein Tco_1170971 [Tanacetum coccineum]
MSRANPQATIISKDQLVPRANRLVIKNNNQRVASDSDITDTILRFVVEILRHHKLYKPVSLNANMSPPNLNNTYTKPPSENQILGFIKTLGYDEDLDTKMIDVSKMDEFEWQIVDRSSRPSKMSKLLYTRFTKLIINHFLSCNKSIPRRSNSELHNAQDDQLITKLTNIVKGDYKFGMEILDTMISDAIKKSAGYNYYIAMKKESER